MSADFTIDVEPARDLVRIRMRGFFTPEHIAAFAAARAEAHRRLTCGPNQHLTINDLREMKIQSQEIVDAFRAMLSKSDAYRSRKLAFIVASTLARAQLGRTLGGRNARCFEDPADAEAWLFSADDAQAA